MNEDLNKNEMNEALEESNFIVEAFFEEYRRISIRCKRSTNQNENVQRTDQLKRLIVSTARKMDGLQGGRPHRFAKDHQHLRGARLT